MSTDFKPFFVHYIRTKRKSDNSHRRHLPAGFTAYIQPSALDRHVQVQMAFCSPKDEFCKKEGRSFAQAATIEAINTRKVPELLASAQQVCGRITFADKYNYVLKYMV